jgi:hypothetical protein
MADAAAVEPTTAWRNLWDVFRTLPTLCEASCPRFAGCWRDVTNAILPAIAGSPDAALWRDSRKRRPSCIRAGSGNLAHCSSTVVTLTDDNGATFERILDDDDFR